MSLVLAVTLCAPVLFGCAPDTGIGSEIRFVVHGGGSLDGFDLYGQPMTYTCSNSAEGLAQCAAAEVPFVEIDFSITSDGHLVCLHDWYHMYAPEIETDVALSYADFMQCHIYRNFTPIAIEEVAEFLRANEYAHVVTDIKADNIEGLTAIAETCPDLKNRFIVQIYAADEYDKVRDLGFDKIIYTLYRLTWNEKTDTAALAAFAKKHPLVGYTFSAELCDIDGYVEKMKKTGVPLFIHTVDGEEEQQKYFDMGIDGIYTNEVKK